jgi:hypothetical protein
VQAGTLVSVKPHLLAAQIQGIYGMFVSELFAPHFPIRGLRGGTRHIKVELLGLEGETALILTWILIFDVL